MGTNETTALKSKYTNFINRYGSSVTRNRYTKTQSTINDSTTTITLSSTATYTAKRGKMTKKIMYEQPGTFTDTDILMDFDYNADIATDDEIVDSSAGVTYRVVTVMDSFTESVLIYRRAVLRKYV